MSNDVGSLIKAARKRAGLNATDLARVLQCNPSQVSRWEQNRQRPAGDMPQRLVEVLGLEPAEFYKALAAVTAPVRVVSVEDAVRADQSLSAEAKVQLVSLYHFLTRDRHERALDAKLEDWAEAEGDVTESGVTDSSHTAPPCKR